MQILHSAHLMLSITFITSTLDLVRQTREAILKSNAIEEKAIWRIDSSSDEDSSDEEPSNEYTSTDPEIICQYDFEDSTLSKRLFLTTDKSLPRIHEAMKYTPTETIGFGIFDQAHRMEGYSTETKF
mmetsp:Transcript_8673/g.13289  ORF Transcript_8673/g.13289 Transcript_8673/m.13289 type:complete len:127 (+) Transcript_8673:126-506(+)